MRRSWHTRPRDPRRRVIDPRYLLLTPEEMPESVPTVEWSEEVEAACVENYNRMRMRVLAGMILAMLGGR